MLKSFVKIFDHAAFETKLRHYFADSSPIYAEVEIAVNAVKITSNDKSIKILLDEKLNVEKNIGRIIECCELALYPVMLDLSEQAEEMPEDKRTEMLFHGFSIKRIYEKQSKKNLETVFYSTL